MLPTVLSRFASSFPTTDGCADLSKLVAGSVALVPFWLLPHPSSLRPLAIRLNPVSNLSLKRAFKETSFPPLDTPAAREDEQEADLVGILLSLIF